MPPRLISSMGFTPVHIQNNPAPIEQERPQALAAESAISVSSAFAPVEVVLEGSFDGIPQGRSGVCIAQPLRQQLFTQECDQVSSADTPLEHITTFRVHCHSRACYSFGMHGIEMEGQVLRLNEHFLKDRTVPGRVTNVKQQVSCLASADCFRN